MYKVLITGVSGFIGSYLLNYLRENGKYHITGLSREPEKLSDNLDSKLSYEDVFNSAYNYHIYIHLAGQVIKEDRNIAEDHYKSANYSLTKKVYDRFLNDELSKKFIFLSSIHVLTEIPETIIDESYIPEPFTAYGRSKFKAENYIISNRIDKKHVYILRPTMIHGPGNKGNLKSLYDYLIAGWPYLFGAANNKRSFLSIENLSFILMEFIDNDIEDGLYHISDDEPTLTLDLINHISKISGVKVKVINIPLIFLRVIAYISNYLPVPFDIHRYGKLT
ncbi:MAG: NAD-dependent epimerase/dehydratase family protein, partial [Candidatus Paceibacterota bacterium]